MTFVSQEHKKNLSQKENHSKVHTTRELVGEINPDNFTYESDFMPKIKTEIKQENFEELPLLVTNVQSLNEPSKSKVKKLPLEEASMSEAEMRLELKYFRARYKSHLDRVPYGQNVKGTKKRRCGVCDGITLLPNYFFN